VLLGDVTVRLGDLVIGDTDGVVAIPAARIEQAMRAAEARDRKEAAIMAELRAGRTNTGAARPAGARSGR